MWLKYALFFAAFFIALVLQAGFFAHFPILGTVPNLVFCVFFWSIFFEDTGRYWRGILSVLLAGFLLDAMGPFSFGPSFLALLLMYGIMKSIKHFLREHDSSQIIVPFIVMFIVFLFSYDVIFAFIRYFPNIGRVFDIKIAVEIAYSLVFALAGLLLYRKFQRKPERQLKLFM